MESGLTDLLMVQLPETEEKQELRRDQISRLIYSNPEHAIALLEALAP
ncbi:MAG: hypothetical protein GWQ05_07175 [Verrucomicrobiaceae bacterium]|nr:hypothetical protein [Verrucomicrobiaceae bacterium]